MLDSFHDRFIIIDNKTLYHSGASFKDLDKKCFAINKIENKTLLNNLLKIINKQNFTLICKVLYSTNITFHAKIYFS